MRKLLIACVLLALIVLGAIGFVYFKFFYTKPLSQGEREELMVDWDRITHGNWSPWVTIDDGSKEWNPALGFNTWIQSIPEEEKAWPILAEAQYEYSDLLEDPLFVRIRTCLPSERYRWEFLVPILESDRARELTEILKDAVSKPSMGLPLMISTDPYSHSAMLKHDIEDDDWDDTPPQNPYLMGFLLPSLGQSRSSAYLLRSQAALALEKNDPDTFVELLVVASNAGDLSSEYPALIAGLVHIAIDHQILETIDWALINHPDQFSTDHLIALKQIARITADPAKAFLGEYLMAVDTLRRLLDDTGTLSLDSFGGGASLDFELATKDPIHLPDQELGDSSQRLMLMYLEYLDQCIAESGPIPGKEWSVTGDSDEFVESVQIQAGLFPKMFLDIMMPPTRKAAARSAEAQQRSIATDLALSIHIHKLKHGSFPQTLDDLDPQIPTLDPIDFITGQRLLYTLTDGHPKIYSVGNDRDDDGGLTRWETITAGPDDNPVEIQVPVFTHLATPRSKDNDWVLFPMPTSDPEPLGDYELELLNTP